MPEDPQDTKDIPQDEDEREPIHYLLCDSPTLLQITRICLLQSDPEEDPEEYEDDETEDIMNEDEEEEEEEHLAPADSAIIIPDDEPVFPPEGTEPASISLPPEAKVKRLLAMTTPSPSPPISLSPPYAGERLARCMALPAHSSPLLPSSGCPTQIQTKKIASTQALIDAVTVALPSPPLPSLPPSLYIPPPVDHRDDIPESEQPPHKRLCLSTLGSRYEIRESSTARPTRGQGIDYGFVSTVDAEERRQGIRDVGYGIRDTWVDPAKAVPKIAPVTLGEVSYITASRYGLAVGRFTYGGYDDSLGDSMDGGGGGICFPRGLGSLNRIVSGSSDTATAAEYSHSDTASKMSNMQAELLALREQQRGARQPGLEARIPDCQDASGDADSHI
ncbi:hypothetical protein Tco_1474852 [Tanacetum coccineum]